MNSEIAIGSIWTANNLHRKDLVPNVVIISEELTFTDSGGFGTPTPWRLVLTSEGRVISLWFCIQIFNINTINYDLGIRSSKDAR